MNRVNSVALRTGNERFCHCHCHLCLVDSTYVHVQRVSTAGPAAASIRWMEMTGRQKRTWILELGQIVRPRRLGLHVRSAVVF